MLFRSTAQIRQQPKYGNLPIILVTTLAKDEDKRRGALAGASAYITKGDFDQSLLIQTRSEERRVGKECRSRWSPYH